VREASEKAIMKLISREINKSQFNRMNMMHENEPIYESYDHFIKHNEKCVKNLSECDLDFTIKLIERMDEIVHSDSECFGDWESRGIYFDISDKLVIMHQ